RRPRPPARARGPPVGPSGSPGACARRSTTATRRGRPGPRSERARTSCSPTRTCCTWESSPTTGHGPSSSPTWRWWSSTRPMCTAACSARTWPTCCAGCAGARRSALGEAGELLARLVRDGARAICFMKSRKGVEVLARLVKQELADTDPELAELVVPYRAGYTPQQRRELEGRLTRGELRAVITTDALELGIDIGELDAAVVVTFPGTVASLRQMWGRAGRRGRGLALYVAGEDALDQFFCRPPEELLERPVEAAILDHESALIYRAHLLCAAHEGPLDGTDAEFLGPRWETHAEQVVSAGALRRRGGAAISAGAYVPREGGGYPAAEVSLRSASAESFAIVDV